jgi:uncharacterized lipoprotein
MRASARCRRGRGCCGNATDGVPSAQDPLGMHIERDGDRRWLVVDGRTPEQLWPILKEFWQENGFSLKTDAPSTGIMATDWAENRANIPTTGSAARSARSSTSHIRRARAIASARS